MHHWAWLLPTYIYGRMEASSCSLPTLTASQSDSHFLCQLCRRIRTTVAVALAGCRWLWMNKDLSYNSCSQVNLDEQRLRLKRPFAADCGCLENNGESACVAQNKGWMNIVKEREGNQSERNGCICLYIDGPGGLFTIIHTFSTPSIHTTRY